MKLEEFLVEVTTLCLGPQGCTDPDDILRILKFLDYPFMEEYLATAHLGVEDEDYDEDDDALSSSSEIGPSPSGGLAELFDEAISSTNSANGSFATNGEPIPHSPSVPMIVTTRWRAPATLPALHIGLSLPYVNIAKDINGLWVADVRGERISRKGLMQQRYDEAVSMCEKLKSSPRLMDATEAQQHLQAFRRSHPLTWYIRKEQQQHSQLSLREDESNYSSTSSHRNGNCLTDSGSVCDGEIGSPTFHHPRPLSSPVVPATSIIAVPKRSSSPVQHFYLDLEAMQPMSPVAGCKCDEKSYCSTSKGDTYVLPSGFTILVVPPKTSGNASV